MTSRGLGYPELITHIEFQSNVLLKYKNKKRNLGGIFLNCFLIDVLILIKNQRYNLTT